MKSLYVMLFSVFTILHASQVWYEKIDVDINKDVDCIVVTTIDSSSYREHLMNFPNGVQRPTDIEYRYHFSQEKCLKGTYPKDTFSLSFHQPYGVIYDSLGNDLIYESPIILPMSTPPAGQSGDKTLLLFSKNREQFFYLGSMPIDSLKSMEKQLKE